MTGPTPTVVDDDVLAREAEILARHRADPLLGEAAAPRPISSRVPLTGLVDLAPLDTLAGDAPVDAIDRALVAVRESIPYATDRLTRETLRETIRRQYPRIPARMVDAATAPPPRTTAATPPGDATRPTREASGSPVTLDEPEPWPEAVDGAALLRDTAAAIRRYVVVTPAQAVAIALWIGVAYAIDDLTCAPILLLASPTPRAGKTTLAIVVGALTPRAILVSSVSAAVVYRLIEAHRPTLIGDEADTWLTDERSELRGVLNAGHTRATATVARCVGDDHDVRLYSVWCARCLAMIGRPPSTILDRSIIVELRRRTADEPIERLRQDRIDDELRPLRRQWRRWIDDHARAIGAADPDVPTSLHDRAADCWRPLLAIADLAGGDWPGRARSAAVELSGGDAASDESVTVGLLADVRMIYDARNVDVLTSEDLTAALVAMTDRPWADWSRGRPLTQARLARLVRPYGIVPVVYRVGSRTPRGYRRGQWIDAWTRYLGGGDDPSDPPDMPHPSPPAPGSGPVDPQQRNNADIHWSDREKSKCNTAPNVALRKAPDRPINTGLCDAVAGSTARSRPAMWMDPDPALVADVDAVTSPLSDWGLDEDPNPEGPYGV
jgi:putative DNA primase/helicase